MNPNSNTNARLVNKLFLQRNVYKAILTLNTVHGEETPKRSIHSLAYKTIKRNLEKQKLIQTPPTIKLNNVELENVAEYKYLGNVISADGNSLELLKARLDNAEHKLYELRKILIHPSLSKKFKLRLIKSTIVPIAIYGCESWDFLNNKPETDKGFNKNLTE